ncbi:hypothetical protein [Chromohalobacter israelensis]|uniref:hypothetical protein n=1 Tax=Chromohalobacter israelensis TaxID=141390 RepID=UPI0015C420B3|nr:hypothetical protein [Chromohalobacter salexigens]
MAASASLLPFYLLTVFSLPEVFKNPITSLFESLCGLILIASMLIHATESFYKNSDPEITESFMNLTIKKCPELTYNEVKGIRIKGLKLCSSKAMLDLSHDVMEIQKNLYLPPETGIINAFTPPRQLKKEEKETCHKYYQKLKKACPRINQ